MLTLQRASAGSGKTYTLTKKFIRLLISISEDGGRPRLRTDAELRDSVSHILAITFTNKATAEMKERIIDRLTDLAYHVDPSAPDKTTYLQEFIDEFNTTPQELSRICRIALHQLLYSYSDFNVQTIDSFFQAILRTFAYEADLPDSYEVIIDNNFVNRQAVGGMVDNLTDRTLAKEPSYWIKKLIRDEQHADFKRWNIFSQQENASSRPNSQSLFTKICKMADNLDNESYKEVRSSLEDYIKKGRTFREDMAEIDKYFDDLLSDKFALMINAAHEISDACDIFAPLSPSETIADGSRTIKKLDKILNPEILPTDSSVKWNVQEWDNSSCLGGKAKKNKSNIAIARPLADAMNKMNEAYAAWQEALHGDYALWLLFRNGYPRMALILTLREYVDTILRDNGAMKLSNTNTILRRIIADDDVPFIYERFGTRLNHYLIDEFQDTSRLQWENILPLLNESHSRRNENLIIGDAKQSIYRFRNADPTLITHRVPEAFADIDERGYALMENANRRSERRIVEFNNFIFRNLSADLGEEYADLYTNTVQYPANRRNEGYCEVAFYQTPPKELGEDDDDSQRKIPKTVASRLGPLIGDLLKRGYRQKEIAILVNSNDGGREAIEALIEYNRTLPEGAEKLEFVSEDSLVLSSSDAVNTVMGCLKMIQNGIEGKLNEDDNRDRNEKSKSGSSRINWADIAGHFRYYSIHHQHLSLQQRLQNFFDGDFDNDVIETLLSDMQAVTLPSLVEALTETFVPTPMREEQSVFLAALQDAVLDYCEVYPADIGSLLRWWERKGKSTSISSPEGTDAINIMTIHKSKGLEFECVILPEFNEAFEMKSSWKWVDVPEDFPTKDIMPAKVLIEMKKEPETKPTPLSPIWADTPYGDVYDEERYQTIVDKLNKTYVAMTRPVTEMYLFLPAPAESKKESVKLNHYLMQILQNAALRHDEIAEEERAIVVDTEYLKLETRIPPYSPETTDEKKSGDEDDDNEEPSVQTEDIFIYGEKPTDVASLLEERRKKKESKAEQRDIGDYFVNSDRPLLHYHEENMPGYLDQADDDRIDPRSEGSLLHAVLENVTVEEDLPMAFERLRLKGKLSRQDIKTYGGHLAKALEKIRPRKWFTNEYKIINERPLLKKGMIMNRPDRVMIDNEGNIIVVDYKFGSRDNGKEHHRQVRNYMKRLMEAFGPDARVEGFLWYVNEGIVEDVKL